MRVDTTRKLGAKTQAWAEELAAKYNVDVSFITDIYRNIPGSRSTGIRRKNVEKYLTKIFKGTETVDAPDIPPYPCDVRCTPAEKTVCCGCPQELEWQKKYGGE